MESYTLEQMLDVAESLFAGSDGSDNKEYARGICELLGRLRLDKGGIGEGTGENAILIAQDLGLADRFIF